MDELYDKFDGEYDLMCLEDVLEVDCVNQSGGDWYRALLALSNGGKVMHGVNTAPACETLGFAPGDETTAGVVVEVGDKNVFLDGVDQEDEFAPRAGTDFTGHTTSSPFEDLLDTDDWLPSSEKRANAAFRLAACAEAVGQPWDEIEDGLAAITGERVPLDDVRDVVSQVGSIKRLVGATEKANHAVFSPGSFQRSVSVDLNQMSGEKFGPEKAIDWARLVVIARVTAQMNYVCSPRYRRVSRGKQLKYLLVKGAWSSADPNLHRLPKFDTGPKVDLKPFGVAPIADLPVERRITSASRLSNLIAEYEAVGEHTEAILLNMRKLAEKARGTAVRVGVGTSSLGAQVTHRLTAESAAKLTASAGTTFECLCHAMASIYRRDRDAMVRAQEVRTKFDYTREDLLHNAVARFQPLVFAQAVWNVAHAEAARRLADRRLAHNRMERLYRTISRSSGSHERVGRPPPIVLQLDAPVYRRLARRMVNPGQEGDYKLQDIIPPRVAEARESRREGLEAVSRALASRVAKYSDKYERMATATEDKGLAVKYRVASMAFNTARLGEYASKDAGYYDNTNPLAFYLVRSALGYGRKRRKKLPYNALLAATNSTEVALALDKGMLEEGDTKFAEVEEFCRERLDALYEDVREGGELLARIGERVEDERRSVVPPMNIEAKLEEKVEPKVEEKPKKASGGAAGFMAAFLAKAAAAGVGGESMVLGGRRKRGVEAGYASWPSRDAAELAGRLNGYEGYAEAFAKLGDKAAYDEENEFTKTYFAKRPVEARSAASDVDDVRPAVV